MHNENKTTVGASRRAIGKAARPAASGVWRWTSLAVACSMVTGCATAPGAYLKETFASDDPCSNNARNIGIAAGVIAGAVLGNVVSSNKKVGTLLGAGVGAALGGLIGADMDRRRCELSRIAKKHGLDVTVVDIAADGSALAPATRDREQGGLGMSVSVRDAGTGGSSQFASGSSVLAPDARVAFTEIAQQYAYAAQARMLGPKSTTQERQAVEALKSRRILLIGHTDDTGSSRLNAELSEQRARAVAALFRDAGVTESQLYYQGAGETMPLADNRDETGRAKNRRVEIVDVTDESAFAKYLAARRPNVAFYRESAADRTQSGRDSGEANGAAQKKSATTARAGDRPKTQSPVRTASAASPRQGDARSDAVKVPAGDRPVTSASATASPAPAQKQGPVTQTRIVSAPSIDFGGTPSGRSVMVPDLGKLDRPTGFALISSAVADTPLARCDQDRPREARAVKSLSDDKAYRTADYMPGLYNTIWTDTVNGHLVALKGVAVLRDGGAPARSPEVLVYRDYHDAGQVADLRTEAQVNTYRGDKGLLYRVFVNKAPLQCLDIVIPHATPDQARGSWLRYDKDGNSYSAAFSPRMAGGGKI
ncbi:OmpA family protein [Cupriavidus sp. KK10]|uniref:OmpA family protein n=1 Tax=Cupriavidus sp. KK10 TaxID=1478019 RepID=UPI001BA74A5F|nr:OmpA family protein [Cupriavidus sp. KK10]QUN28421.1 OmpA family protein [Cupriavidus sp. KK10]